MVKLEEIKFQKTENQAFSPRRKQIIHLLTEMIEILNSQPPKPDFWCGTAQIQYYYHLTKNCQAKYEELYSLKQFDTRQQKLLEYLKESLNRMKQEEGEHNQQVALLTCQSILKREENPSILNKLEK